MGSWKRSLKSILLTAMVIVLLIEVPLAEALVGTIRPIAKIAGAVSNKKIKALVKLSEEANGTKKVGETLGKLKLFENLPEDARLKLLEDTYLRIAIAQGRMLRKEAKEMYRNLSGVQGFRTTLGKITGNNPLATKGHLNELRISNEASRRGFSVLGIGRPFDDGIKKSATDIDIILDKGEKKFIIEAKDSINFADMIQFRQDISTLVQYKKQHGGIPIFTITNRPNSPQRIRQMQGEAERQGVQLIFGNPSEQIIKIEMLEQII